MKSAFFKFKNDVLYPIFSGFAVGSLYPKHEYAAYILGALFLASIIGQMIYESDWIDIY